MCYLAKCLTETRNNLSILALPSSPVIVTSIFRGIPN